MILTTEQMEMAENQAQAVNQEVQLLSHELDQMEGRLNDWSSRQRYSGKTIAEWTEYFSIAMNPNATPVEVKHYASMLNERIDTANREKAKVQMAYSQYKAKYEQAKGDIIEGHANNRSRKTIPAADTLVKVAESELGVKTSMCLRYENQLNFWQDMVFKLKDTLRLINLLAMSNGTLAKIEGAY